ncbi:hypothetical protein STCU_05229 [Strigomonas culicis]|uniref:Uncharacterized protein n=1 Tax=Strigomonas culicis TaxID=28005 RepID=S9UHN8_9TRYP|nr:hypothetical protein STCU_05229 [Strigomonas culicis]|eukprot:EPY28244.1 hypothetical protein STCU_05229 [Strigomonas culicis]
MVFCHQHKRWRAAHQMVEEQPGTWRCKREHPCRTRAAADDGRPRASAQGQEWFASRAERDARSPRDTPQPERVSRKEDRSGAHFATRQVWCARHGKRLNAYMCEEVQDCCFVCKDSGNCLATPLDPPADLPQDCPELLCARHQTIRLTHFLELSADKQEYQCLREHRCRYTTLVGRTPGTAAVAGTAQQPDEVEEEGGYFNSDVGNGFSDVAQAPGREAVSSFFV